MVASRAARARKAAVDAGDLAQVRIDLDSQGGFAYKISCTSCTTAPARGAPGKGSPAKGAPGKGAPAWSTYRAGGDNGYLAAMDRWIFHLHEQHAGTTAPCLAYLPEAQQRLHERRLEQERRS